MKTRTDSVLLFLYCYSTGAAVEFLVFGGATVMGAAGILGYLAYLYLDADEYEGW